MKEIVACLFFPVLLFLIHEEMAERFGRYTFWEQFKNWLKRKTEGME